MMSPAQIQQLPVRQSRHETSLRHLNEVAAITHLPLAEHLRKALQAGCAHFGLSMGIVSRIENESYEILSHHSPPGTLSDHQRFPLGDTYCSLTLRASDVVTMHHVGASELKGHPCYQQFGLEAYIGTPLVVAGNVFGTANFSSSEPCAEIFDEQDKEFIRLLARWIGATIERNEIERRHRALFENMLEGLVHFQVLKNEEGVVDLLYKDVNPAFERLVGVKNIIGRTLLSAFPGLREEHPDFFVLCGSLARQGGNAQFEMYLASFQKWFSVSMYSPEPDHVICIFDDVTKRKLYEENIIRLAYVDSLTGLPNRRMLDERLTQSLAQASRHERALALLFIDLDHFKQVNDRFGHLYGDELLKEVARRLESCVRVGDTVSRNGGDEFVILLPEVASEKDAVTVAIKIIDALQPPYLISGQSLQAGASIGIVLRTPGDACDAGELLNRADQALYAVKEAGRNGYEVYRR